MLTQQAVMPDPLGPVVVVDRILPHVLGQAAASGDLSGTVYWVQTDDDPAPQVRGEIAQLARTRLHFASNRAEVREEARQRLADVAEAARLSNGVVKVLAYADARGSARYNGKLSLRRAEAVRRELLALGLEPRQVEVRGRGESEPVASNRTADGRAQNRRADLNIEPGVEQ